MEDRIYVEFEGGSYINSLHPDFQEEFQNLVAQYGPPVLVEYRPAGLL